jgi:hypothetical protein
MLQSIRGMERQQEKQNQVEQKNADSRPEASNIYRQDKDNRVEELT